MFPHLIHRHLDPVTHYGEATVKEFDEHTELEGPTGRILRAVSTMVHRLLSRRRLGVN
jgi:hypothetical protein